MVAEVDGPMSMMRSCVPAKDEHHHHPESFYPYHTAARSTEDLSRFKRESSRKNKDDLSPRRPPHRRERVGVDLSEFYMSVEWDILEVPAVRNEKFYTCCDEPYLDITFNITMRRKTLFYTVNIIIPCMGISFLTVLTFYLPSDSGEKVTLSISILISLHVFFLLVVEIIPPTSLVVPLLGKYLIFAMILVSISICVTVVVLNVHFRSPQTHKMAPWVKRVFIQFLPRILVMRRPLYNPDGSHLADGPLIGGSGGSCKIHGHVSLSNILTEAILSSSPQDDSKHLRPPAFSHAQCPPVMHRSCFCVRFIAEHTRMQDDSTKVKEDWKYVALVLDRLFLWIFTLAVLGGTAGIILQAPSLYDDRVPIDSKFAEIANSNSQFKCPPPK
ncbi:acetylcholine receptor subunit alpha-like [Diaphorina citri]|uniref:Acetylcholine receptor subunit alpha-like n=1 Tax=Diaphorina citri TaxID=121845 RepID=A0A1S3DAT6_DIACI|nr:acetylcholine receptor subunit alpha-like [Diaphorina citri]